MVQVNLRAGTWSPTYGYQFQQGWFMTLDNKPGQSASALPGAEGYTYELYFKPQSPLLDPLFPEFLVDHKDYGNLAHESKMTLQSLVVEEMPDLSLTPLDEPITFSSGQEGWYFEKPAGSNALGQFEPGDLKITGYYEGDEGYWVSPELLIAPGWIYGIKFEVKAAPFGGDAADLILKAAVKKTGAAATEGSQESEMYVTAAESFAGGRASPASSTENTSYELYFAPRSDAVQGGDRLVIRFGFRNPSDDTRILKLDTVVVSGR